MACRTIFRVLEMQCREDADAEEHTGRFVEMRKVRQIITGFQHRRVHQRWEGRIHVILKGGGRCFNSFGLSL